MAIVCRPFLQAQRAGNASKEFTRLEVDFLRGRGRLSVGIGVDFRNIVSSVCLGIAIDRIVIKDDNNLSHRISLFYEPTALVRLRISAYMAEEVASVRNCSLLLRCAAY